MVKNPPANAGDIGSISRPGKFHMYPSNKARVLQLLSLCVASTEALTPRTQAREATAVRNPYTVTGE